MHSYLVMAFQWYQEHRRGELWFGTSNIMTYKTKQTTLIDRCLWRTMLLNGCRVNIQFHPELTDSMGSNSNASSITFRKNIKLDPELRDFMACKRNTLKLQSEQILFQLLSTVVWSVSRGRGISYLLLHMEMGIGSSVILVKLSCQLTLTSNLSSNTMGALTRDRLLLLEQESRTRRSSSSSNHAQTRKRHEVFVPWINSCG